MAYDNQLIAKKLRRWDKYLNNYHLPEWNSIPDLGLYMEQMIELLGRHLDYLPPELKEEQFITAATINNYVRTKVMPGPRKKKYYREHIAYLIIILTLKNSLSIAMIQKLIPMGLSREEVEQIYTAYVRSHSMAARYFTEQVTLAAANLLGHEDAPDFAVDSTEDLITMSAIIGGFTRLLSEKLLLLDQKTLETGGDTTIPDNK